MPAGTTEHVIVLPHFHSDITNEDRAAMVAPLIRAFARAYYWGDGVTEDEDEPLLDYHVSDFVADVIHYCDQFEVTDGDRVYRQRWATVKAKAEDDHNWEVREEAGCDEEVCPDCSSTGILVGQTYENIDCPDGWTPVQRCDACDIFDGDEAAAKALAHQLGTEHRWVDAGDNPGDFIVRLPTKETP